VKKNLSAYITAITLISSLAASIQLAAQELQPQKKELPRYTIIDLGPAADWVGGVNNKGSVDGTAILLDGTQHAFLWRKGAKTVLGTFGGPNSAAFKGPTEKGQVVGKAETPTPDPFGEDFCGFGTQLICVPFVWQNGAKAPLRTLGGNNGIAFGVNNRGQVAGSAENTTQDPTCPIPSLEAKAVIWEKDEIQELPTFPGDTDSAVISINDDSQAVGISTNCFATLRNVLWQHGTVIDLGNLGGTVTNEPNNINNQGQVVGFSDLPGDASFHAFLWTEDKGMQDLGTLPGDVFSGGDGNNDKGQVVGFSCNADFSICRAFLWQNGTMTDLNTLIPASPLSLFEAFGINSRGEITGVAIDQTTDETRAFLAVPENSETAGSDPSGAAAETSRPNVVLPENVRKMLRQRLGFGHFMRSPQQVTLGKTAVNSAPTATLSPTSLTFSAQGIGTTSPAKSVTLKNTGTASLTITSIAITGTNAGDFAQTHTCGSSLAAGASCTISVTFKPTASGTRSAALSVTDNAAGSPQKVTLSGIGTTAKLSPTSLNFGTVAIGTTSAAKTATLTNVGTTSLSINGVAITGTNAGDFAQTHTCGSSLAAGASCTISVTFKPTASGTRSAALSVTDNAAGSPQKVPVSGIGTTAKLSPTSLSFGTVAIGTTSPAKTVTLTNVGTTSLSITGIAITGTNTGDFAQTHTCGTSLAAGASCSINVTFKPTASGTRTATLSISDNGGGSPQSVPLSGTGVGSCTPFGGRCGPGLPRCCPAPFPHHSFCSNPTGFGTCLMN